MHASFGLEGVVSKRRDRPYQAGRSKHWLKVKNRSYPAMSRVRSAETCETFGCSSPKGSLP
jgi:ATP-dependent DNA ligase